MLRSLLQHQVQFKYAILLSPCSASTCMLLNSDCFLGCDFCLKGNLVERGSNHRLIAS